MVKKFNIFLVLITIFGCLQGFSQIQNPVNWSYSAKKTAPKTFEIRLVGMIDESWHIYPLDHKGEIGVATSLTLKKNNNVLSAGASKFIGKTITFKDPSTDEIVKFYEGKVEIVKVIKLKLPLKTNLNGSIEFMACDDRQCLPPKSVDFSLILN